MPPMTARMTCVFHLMRSSRIGTREILARGPTPYPAANAPQAWAAAAVFMFLAACLGLSIDAPQSQIRFTHPMLPPFLDEVRITNLRVGDAAIDLTLHRYPSDVGITASNRRGAVEVVAIK